MKTVSYFAMATKSLQRGAKRPFNKPDGSYAKCPYRKSLPTARISYRVAAIIQREHRLFDWFGTQAFRVPFLGNNSPIGEGLELWRHKPYGRFYHEFGLIKVDRAPISIMGMIRVSAGPPGASALTVTLPFRQRPSTDANVANPSAALDDLSSRCVDWFRPR